MSEEQYGQLQTLIRSHLTSSEGADNLWRLFSFSATPADIVGQHDQVILPLTCTSRALTGPDASSSSSNSSSSSSSSSSSAASSSSSSSLLPLTELFPAAEEENRALLDDIDVGRLQTLAMQLQITESSSQQSLSQIDVHGLLEELFSLVLSNIRGGTDEANELCIDAAFEHATVISWNDTIVAAAVRVLLQLSTSTSTAHTRQCLASLIRKRVLQLARPMSRDVFTSLTELSNRDPSMLVDVVFVNLLRTTRGNLSSFQTEFANRLTKECLPVVVVPQLLERAFALFEAQEAQLSEDLFVLFKNLLDMKQLELSTGLADLLLRVLELHADKFSSSSKFLALIFTIITRHPSHAARLHEQLREVLTASKAFMAKPALKKLDDLVNKSK